MTAARARVRLPQALIVARWVLLLLGVIWLASWWYPPARGPQLTSREVKLLATQPGGPPPYLQEPFELLATPTSIEGNRIVLDDGSLIQVQHPGPIKGLVAGQSTPFRVVLVGITNGHLQFETRQRIAFELGR